MNDSDGSHSPGAIAREPITSEKDDPDQRRLYPATPYVTDRRI